MPGTTTIEWTDASWNPVTGCSKVSAGCTHCYAEALSTRFKRTTKPWTHPFAAENVMLHPERLDEPLKWRQPRKIFVNSMSDLFHEFVPAEYIAQVFGVMALCPHHTFQVLTKRPARMFQLLVDDTATQAIGEEIDTLLAHEEWRTGRLFRRDDWTWPLPNVWLGVSVEDQRVTDRIAWLLRTPAAVRFLSCEPLLAPLDLTDLRLDSFTRVNPLTGRITAMSGRDEGRMGRIDWVITGGESGPHHRPFDPQWARDIRDQCQAAGVAYFHKQHGGRTPKAGGRLLDGVEWSQFPAPAEMTADGSTDG